MSRLLICRKKTRLLTFLLFLIGLLVLSYAGNWWPGILLVTGIPLALKQYFLGKNYDTGITLFVFLGGFLSISCDIQWQIFLPVLFTIGAIYILYRDVLENSMRSESEEEENLNEEIEEDQHR